jgi:integrase
LLFGVWLRSLALAPKTKVNLRGLFHLIYEHARRWELTDRNPIDLVRQRGGRRCIPRVLTPVETRLLLAQLAEPYHTMVMVAACLGLRASEIMGLQWRDFNWEDLTVLIRRGVVNGRVGDTKTEASQEPLPIDPRLARSLEKLWKRSLYKSPQDWVFSNRTGRPRAQQDILRRHLRSAALRAGVGKIGWHTFSTFVLDDVARCRHRHQGAARIAPARDHPEHHEHLYPSSFRAETHREQRGDRSSIQ